MIGSLRGTVLERTPPNLLLMEVGGVGYLCTVTTPTFAEFEPGVSGYLFVHHLIREDSQTLYCFKSRADREMFECLIAVHGVGPSIAMAVLSMYSPAAVSSVVAAGDVAGLTAVPGIGKKTAERMMVELKSRLDLSRVAVDTDAFSQSASADVREALAALGYAPEEIRDTMRQLADAGDSESLLRDALSLLGARRAG